MIALDGQILFNIATTMTKPVLVSFVLAISLLKEVQLLELVSIAKQQQQ